MRHFKNGLTHAISISYVSDGASYTTMVKPGADFFFPGGFDGPCSIGLSDEEDDIAVVNAEEKFDGSSNLDISK